MSVAIFFYAVNSAVADTVKPNNSDILDRVAQEIVKDTGVKEQFGQSENGDRLLDQIPLLLEGHEPEPSLVHGDLWSGNAAVMADGTPVIFDPAAYYGDREVDLAMTELFGAFPAAFYQAYKETWPLSPGYQQRKTLYNLYHILNHFNLFGGGYASQAQQMIRQLLR